MNFKTTLVLLLLLAGITGAYLWVQSIGPKGPASNATTPATLVSGRSFSQITVKRTDQTIVLEKQDGRWRQTAPVRFPVASESIEELINAGLALSPRETFVFPENDELIAEDNQPLATFGLDPPRATISYVSDTGTHSLRLGDTNVAGSAYLQTQNDRNVYLVDATLHQLVFGADYRAWRPKTLPTLDASAATRIELQHDQTDIRLVRTADGWSLSPDGGERADGDAAMALASVGQQLKPRSYVSDDPEALAGFGLESPAAVLTLADAREREETLRIGSFADLNQQTVYATWSDTKQASPVVFTLPAASVAALSRVGVDQLRDPRLVTALPGTIRGQLVNRVGRDTIELAQRADGSGYAFIQPQAGYNPDPQIAPQWLTTLVDARPVGSTRAPREAQAPIAIIELKLTGDRSEFVRLYADRDGRDDVILAVREGEAVAAMVPRQQLAPLLEPAIRLRDRTMPATPAESLEMIRITRDDGQEFRFNRQSGDWQLAQGGEDWEVDAFERLLGWLASPRVDEWTSLSELPRGPVVRLSTGPEKPAYVFNTEQNLGQRTDLPGVFKISPEFSALVGGEFRNRFVLPKADRTLQRVTLGLAGATSESDPPPQAAVVRRGTGGVFQDAGGQQYDHQQNAAELFRLLAGLRVTRFLPPLPEDQQRTPIKVFDLKSENDQSHRLLRYNQGVWSIDGERYFYIDVEIDRALTKEDTAWGHALMIPETP